MRRWVLLVTTALAVAMAAGCGGGGSGSADTTQPFVEYTEPAGITFGEWQEQTGAVCEKYEPLKQKTAEAAAKADPTNPRAGADATTAISAQYRAALAAIPEPLARHRDISRLKVVREDLATAIGVLYKAQDGGDQAAIAAAAQAMRTAEVERNALLKDLGVPECASKLSF